MLDKDEIPLADILAAINWASSHEFWRSIVLSAPKLREKYQQMKLQAQRNRRPALAPTGTDGHLAGTDSRLAEHYALIAEMEAERTQ
jgi:hypothetical protein